MQHSLGAPEGVTWEHLRALPAPLRELAAGGIAGGIAKTTISPLERCKILFQTGKLRGAALAPTLSHIYETEGVRGLFRGNGAACVRIVPYAAVHYWAYEHYRRILVSAGVLGAQEHYVPPVLDLLAGSMAGGSAVLLTYPLDLVRTRLAYMTEAGAWPQQQSSRAAGGAAAAAATSAQASAAAEPAARLAGRLPLHYARLAGGGLVLASSRGCSSGACSAGGGGLSGGAGRLATGAPPPTAGISSAGCGSRLQGRGVARALHLLSPHTLEMRHTIRGVLSSTFQKEGLRGLYHGVGASMYGILPYAGLKFYCYQHLKQWYHHTHKGEVTRTGVDGKPRLPVPVMLSFGGMAGLVAQTATYPLDVVRRQMQVEGLKLREAAANSPTAQLSAGTQQLSLRRTPQALLLLAQRHGWRCLFAGLSINYLKVVPSTAIGFTIYDYMKSALSLPTNL